MDKKKNRTGYQTGDRKTDRREISAPAADTLDDLEIDDLEIEDLDAEEFSEEEYGGENAYEETELLDFEEDAEDMEPEDSDEPEDPESESSGEKRLRVSIHLILGIVIIAILGLCFYKYKTFGNRITQEDIDAIPTPDNPEIETYDYFTANPMTDDGTFPTDDGVTTIVCFGNAPFADDAESESGICSQFARESGAVVYNYSVEGSLLAAHENPFTTDYPMDAFSFSYLISSVVSRDKTRLEEAYASMDTVPDGLKDSMDELFAIDFRTVDMIYIMYDGSDYLENSMIYHDQIPDEPRYIAGSLTAGIQSLKEAYPWIDIVVMSPAYAYAIDGDGKYVSSDMQKNQWNVGFSLYFIKEYETAFDNQVSFVDNLYGAIHEDIASGYLTDNLHLNEEGRKLIVGRMMDALTAIQKTKQQ